MALDRLKLENINPHSDGSFTARCPACKGTGGDSKGEHLIVFKNGKYGCVANAGSTQHRKEIHRLAGVKQKERSQSFHAPKPIEIESAWPQTPGRLGRGNSTQ